MLEDVTDAVSIGPCAKSQMLQDESNAIPGHLKICFFTLLGPPLKYRHIRTSLLPQLFDKSVNLTFRV